MKSVIGEKEKARIFDVLFEDLLFQEKDLQNQIDSENLSFEQLVEYASRSYVSGKLDAVKRLILAIEVLADREKF